MPKKLLIVCDIFPPAFAPRIGFLCKLLSEDYEITVITETTDEKENKWPINIDRQNLIVHKIPLRHNEQGAMSRFFDYQSIYWSKITNSRDKKLYKKALGLIGDAKFDVVLCASYYTFPLLCGKMLAAHFNAPLCVDLRDIVEQYAKPCGINRLLFPFKLRWLSTKHRNRILREADATVTISPWHKTILQQYCSNTHLIYNGYDSELFYPKDVATDKFRIVYTGRSFDRQLRDPHLLFAAIDYLAQNRKDLYNLLELNFYTDVKSQNELRVFIRNYKSVENVLTISPLVRMDMVCELLHGSSIVLVLSNKTTDAGPHGIMTTKFFEALGCEKPVLCVRSDEDCLAKVIDECNAGVAARNVEETVKFIEDKYDEWRKNGFTHQCVNQEVKARFSRQNEALQFASVLDSLIRK